MAFCTAQQLRGSVHSTAGMRVVNNRSIAPRTRRGQLQVRAAISRQTKEEQVAKVKDLLQNSTVVYSLRMKDISVKNMESFRRKMPEGATVYVCKNTLVKRAAAEVDDGKWLASLDEALYLDNCWVFLPEDAIKDGVKAFLDFEKALKAAQGPPPKTGPPPPAPTELVGMSLSGEKLDLNGFKKLETMPTKKELVARIAGGVKAVPTKLAFSIKGVSRKLAYAVKACADLNDDKSMTIEAAAAAKPASA